MDTVERAFSTRPAIAVGPAPSRRLGRSIGINHIRPKTCSYSCVYCQVGRTTRLRTARRAFYAEGDIVADVARKVDEARSAGEAIDDLTFVPDGEPALDLNPARVMARLKPLGIKTADISNGSLLWRPAVRDALAATDWVSVKVDAVRQDIWRRVNRPHGTLRLTRVLDGMLLFARTYRGELATETVLVHGINDGSAHLLELAAFLEQLRPARAYLAAPTRPPAERWVEPPPENVINQAYQLCRGRLEHV
jgi:wyosine [tRNA(Phe)-imidazoG37] synthetase (radical SAM superfamily)